MINGKTILKKNCLWKIPALISRLIIIRILTFLTTPNVPIEIKTLSLVHVGSTVRDPLIVRINLGTLSKMNTMMGLVCLILA